MSFDARPYELSVIAVQNEILLSNDVDLLTDLLTSEKPDDFRAACTVVSQTTAPTIYEAAIVDGSSRWHTFWKITLPLLKPTVMLVSIMSMLQCLKTFSTQYMFVQGGTAREPIDVITMNIYFTGIRTGGYLGRASAMSIILFVIMLLLTLLQFKAQKGGEDVEY